MFISTPSALFITVKPYTFSSLFYNINAILNIYNHIGYVHIHTYVCIFVHKCIKNTDLQFVAASIIPKKMSLVSIEWKRRKEK